MRTILKLLFPLLFIICLVYGLNNTQQYSTQQDKNRLEETTLRLCLKYYSIEGRYPDTIDELVSRYGLKYDKQQYIINYYKEADNMLPSIKVYRKEKQYE